MFLFYFYYFFDKTNKSIKIGHGELTVLRLFCGQLADKLARLQNLFLQSSVGEEIAQESREKENLITFAGEQAKPREMPYVLLDPEWYKTTSESERLRQGTANYTATLVNRGHDSLGLLLYTVYFAALSSRMAAILVTRTCTGSGRQGVRSRSLYEQELGI